MYQFLAYLGEIALIFYMFTLYRYDIILSKRVKNSYLITSVDNRSNVITIANSQCFSPGDRIGIIGCSLSPLHSQRDRKSHSGHQENG